MRRCNITVTTRIINPETQYGIPWEALPQETVAKCMTHGMVVEGPVSTDDLCPIGKIEEATEVALRRIEDAVHKT